MKEYLGTKKMIHFRTYAINVLHNMPHCENENIERISLCFIKYIRNNCVCVKMNDETYFGFSTF